MNINRRASITNPLNYNHSSRTHRTTDSSTIHTTGSMATVSAAATAVQQPYGSSSNGPHDKIVHALISRLRSRLPCHSGVTLQALESDRAVLQTAETIIQIARVRPDLVVHSLNDLLEKITKNFPVDANGTIALEVLHSQLYVLKILSAAMNYRWQCHRESLFNNSQNGYADPSSPTSPKPHQKNGTARPENEWTEPPPLEEPIAKYALSVMILFLRQTASVSDRPKTSGHMHSVSFPDFQPHDMSSPFPPPIRHQTSLGSSSSLGSRISSQSLRVSGPHRRIGQISTSHSQPNFVKLMKQSVATAPPRANTNPTIKEFSDTQSQATPHEDAESPSQFLMPRTPLTILSSSSSINWLISKYAGKIVFHLSASNWHVVFGKIKNKIHHLAQSNEENPDMVDMKLISCSALDRIKLIQVMQELASLLVNMKREAQGAVSIALRTALWNWVEYFPKEFLEVFRLPKRLDGAPERLFDTLFSLMETSSKRAFWPTLTILLAVSPERLGRASVGGSSKQKKQNNFLETLVKSLTSTNKASEIAIVCLIDICRAAAYLPPDLANTALGTLAPELADDLRNRIFSPMPPTKPFYETTEMIDVDLYADALVAIFRFNHAMAVDAIFPSCIAPERSEAVKTCALKACLTIATEAKRTASQPPVSTLFPLIATRTRMLVRSIMNRKHEVPGVSVRRPIAKRYNADSFADREQLLLTIFLLWRAHPGFAFYGVGEDDTEYRGLLADGVKLFTQPNDRMIRMAVSRTNMDLLQYAYGLEEGQEWFTESRTHVRYAGTMSTIAASIQLLESRETFEDDRNALSIINQNLDTPMELTEKLLKVERERTPSFDKNLKLYESSLALMELALLVSLPSSQLDIPSIASNCLKKISFYQDLIPSASTSLKPEQATIRKTVFDDLGDSRVMVTGRLASQKRVRRVMSSMGFSSVLNVAVWEECYRKWSLLTDSVTRSSSDDLDPNAIKPYDRRGTSEDRQAEWQNITLFLASFGGSCINDEQLPNISTIISYEELPQRFQRSTRTPIASVKQFISQAVDLLLADSVVARETVKDALGMELHPLLYPLLFTQLHAVISSIFEDQTPQWEEHIIIFIEQTISVLRQIFDRLQDVSETAQINVDIGRLVLYLGRYIHRSATGLSALRIKARFAGLLDSLFLKRDLLPLRKEVSLRNTLLDIATEWAFDTGAADAPYPDREAYIRLQGELDFACLRTAVQLLDRLQLQAVDGTTRAENVHVQSRLFYRYFSLFTKGLARWKQGEGDTNDGDSVSSGTARARGNPKEQRALRELVIAGVTNLLSANMESGLKHCLPLGYSEDPRTRKIFVHIFTRVLKLGTSFVSIDSLEPDRFSRLCEMVRAPDMLLALAICETCPQSDVDDMIGVLLNIFDTRSGLVSLLKAIIDREVAATTDEANLFRSNTMCTRFLSAFAKIHGYNYLRTLLGPLIHQMSAMPSGHSYELDPSKMRDGEDPEENQRNLMIICQAFLDVICESVAVLPSIFREICQHIAASVAAVWPEAKYAAVGGFIFLRFICPAIVSPSTVDIEVPQDNPLIQRGLILITKVIQNLANNILFGKEAMMVVLNKFLTSNIMPVTRFLSEVLKYTPSPGDADQTEFLGVQYDETDHLLLHRYFHANADKIGKELLSYAGPAAARESEFATSGGKQTWDVLCATLVEVGAPMEIPKSPAVPSAQHSRFQEFLQRNGHRNTDSVRSIFLESPTPKDRTPVFILSMHKLNVETVDLELLAAYIFKTLSDAENKSFDIIIDCTSFSSSSEVPIQWLKFFLELTPSDIMQRWAIAYFLNVNAHAQRFLRKLYHFYSGLTVSRSVVACSSVAELLPIIHPMSVTSMSYPLNLEREPKELFAQVNKLDRHRMSHPVSLQVGTTHMRITSSKPKQIWGSVTCKLTEIVVLTDIDDVYNVATGQEVNEFVVRTNGGGTIYFAAIGRETITKAIRSAKGKLKADGQASIERPVQLGNLSATLLNLGLLNVGHEDELLRGAAYDLLRSVCKHLQCDEPLLLPIDGAFIPANPAAFAIQFSERMAKFVPHLTLDFLAEFFVGFDKSTSAQKAVCLQYMSPWIQNLSGFRNPSIPHYEPSAMKLRETIRSMIDITFNHHEVYPLIQRLVWAEMSKLDNRVIQVTLDELFRAAIDGGIASRRCESIADTLVILGSINVRGKVLAKLRRVLGKTTIKPSKTLVENPAWNEVAALARLTLVVMYNNRVPVQTQLFVPEVLHLVTMIVATGPVILRTAVHGIVTNLVQSLCVARTDDDAGKPKLKSLLKDCSSLDTLRLFGLYREDPTTEFILLDCASEQQSVDNLEKVTNFLLEIVEAGAQTVGLANVWRARWVGLVTSTAFQLSAYIQSRAFVVLGSLASPDVDDDLLYQILVAFRTALATSTEGDTSSVVSMLRCIRKLVPGLPENSRYLPHIVWLPIALIQSSYVSLFAESAQLLQATLETLQKQGAFLDNDLATVLAAARVPLDDISSQLDSVLGLSFDDNCFSFALATAIFKGIRHPPTRDAACSVLHTLLRISVRNTSQSFMEQRTIQPDSLGYFLALLPQATTNGKYRQLLDEAGAMRAWSGDPRYEDNDDDEARPRVMFEVLGVGGSTTALLAISFVAAMLNSAHGQREQDVLFHLLASAADTFPEMITLTYDSISDKINDTFATSNSASILESASAIFRLASADAAWPGGPNPSSASIDPLDLSHTGGGSHSYALSQISMAGLINNHQFLPASRSLPLIKWIHELVSRIIE